MDVRRIAQLFHGIEGGSRRGIGRAVGHHHPAPGAADPSHLPEYCQRLHKVMKREPRNDNRERVVFIWQFLYVALLPFNVSRIQPPLEVPRLVEHSRCDVNSGHTPGGARKGAGEHSGAARHVEHHVIRPRLSHPDDAPNRFFVPDLC